MNQNVTVEYVLFQNWSKFRCIMSSTIAFNVDTSLCGLRIQIDRTTTADRPCDNPKAPPPGIRPPVSDHHHQPNASQPRRSHTIAAGRRHLKPHTTPIGCLSPVNSNRYLQRLSEGSRAVSESLAQQLSHRPPPRNTRRRTNLLPVSSAPAP